MINGDNDDDLDIDFTEPVHSMVELTNELGQSIAMTRLRTQEMNMLPKSVVATVVDNMHCLLDTVQFGLQNVIRSRLTAMGIDFMSDSILAEALNGESLFERVTASTSSDHLLQKYCRDNLHLIMPVPMYVACNSNVNDTAGSAGRVLVGHYVPILASIGYYLQHSDVWASYQKRASDSSDILFDYSDGLVWQSAGLPSDHLRIHLYSDEFDVCNPIGSRRGIHKICAFYFTVGNIAVKHRSQLRNIHLAMLLKYKYVRKFGYGRVIEPLIKDLEVLQSRGIDIIVDGECITVKGSVVTLSGDNLSLHGIGGFNPVFNSGRICRHCMVCYSGIRDVMSEDDCLLRSTDGHKYHVQSILADGDLKAVYGVYGECPLSSLDYFDPIQCLPPDVMHDVLEGVMVFIVDMVIKRLVHQRILTMKRIASCMRSFKYGSADITDKPEALPDDFVAKKKSISGRAVEKWCLFRLLPLYIGHLVPADCVEWQLYLSCRCICDFVLAPVVAKDELGMLEVLIAHHHRLLADIGANCFFPKMHYLVHYPRLMMLFGPLRHLWSMRFEANHQYFKQLAKRTRNFKNITATLAGRYQRKKCCEQAGENCRGASLLFPENQTPVSIATLPAQLRDVLLGKFGIPSDAHCRLVKWLTVDGCKLFVNGLLILDKTEDNMPVFLQIQYILQYLGLWVVCGTVIVAESFLNHYHAYSLKSTDEMLAVVPYEPSVNHPVITSYNLNDCEVAVLRHRI